MRAARRTKSGTKDRLESRTKAGTKDRLESGTKSSRKIERSTGWKDKNGGQTKGRTKHRMKDGTKDRLETKKRCRAILLAAGTGSRMKSSVAKQFMLLDGRPLIWYALHALQQSGIIDDCILVTGAEHIPYVRSEIVEKYAFTKVSAVIEGGAERWESVLKAVEYLTEEQERQGQPERLAPSASLEGYIFVCDGARPFLTEQLLQDTWEAVRKHRACVAAVPSKDTVKIADGEGFAVSTPDRRRVYSIQTPQVFEAGLLADAYLRLKREREALKARGIAVTDDASVVELFTDVKVKLVEASYDNLKITTPEDLLVAEMLLGKKSI